NHVRSIEIELREAGSAEGDARAFEDTIARCGRPERKPRSGESLVDAFDQSGDERRARGLEDEAQLVAAIVSIAAEMRRERVPRGRLARAPYRARAIRVVKTEDGGLLVNTRRTEARRVLRIPLDLDGPARVALHEDAGRVTIDYHARRIAT